MRLTPWTTGAKAGQIPPDQAAHEEGMEFGGLSLQTAAQQVLEELPEKSGGLIAVDRDGNFCLPFTSGGMFRGFCNGGEPVGLIWE